MAVRIPTFATLSASSRLDAIYATLRILFGLLGVWFSWGLRDLDMFWFPSGLMPEPSSSSWKAWVIGAGLGPTVGVSLFVTNLAMSMSMAVGYKSRLSVVGSFLAAISGGWWNPLPLSGAFEVRSAILFGLMWAESGRVWSVDAWQRTRRGTADTSPDGAESHWPLTIIRCQIAIIYLSTGLYKLGGEQWKAGTALHYALSNNGFARFSSPPPPEFEGLLSLCTYVTLAWELIFPLLVAFRASRLVALGVGVGMHLGTWIAMELGPFPWVMLASYVSFVDAKAPKGSTLPKSHQVAPTGN